MQRHCCCFIFQWFIWEHDAAFSSHTFCFNHRRRIASPSFHGDARITEAINATPENEQWAKVDGVYIEIPACCNSRVSPKPHGETFKYSRGFLKWSWWMGGLIINPRPAGCAHSGCWPPKTQRPIEDICYAQVLCCADAVGCYLCVTVTFSDTRSSGRDAVGEKIHLNVGESCYFLFCCARGSHFYRKKIVGAQYPGNVMNDSTWQKGNPTWIAHTENWSKYQLH